MIKKNMVFVKEKTELSLINNNISKHSKLKPKHSKLKPKFKVLKLLNLFFGLGLTTLAVASSLGLTTLAVASNAATGLIPEAEWHQLLAQADLGDVHGFFSVAEAYAQGLGPKQEIDLVKAAAFYRMAAASELAIGQRRLAQAYRDGVGLTQNSQKSLFWYEKAAEQGDIDSILEVANCYKGWYRMPTDFNRALYWYKFGAGLGSPLAEAEFADLVARADVFQLEVYQDLTKAEQLDTALLMLEQASKNDNAEALFTLGNIYFTGFAGKLDVALGLDYYKKAANLGSARAAHILGKIYSEGKLVKVDQRTATQYFYQAAQAEWPAAQYILAERLLNGYGVKVNAKQAVAWLEQAASLNYLPAILKLGDLHLTGGVVARYYPYAARYYQMATEHVAGSAYAHFMLSVFYQDGLLNQQVDLEKSSMHYSAGVKLADAALAQYKVALRYLQGKGLAADLQAGTNWLHLAAEAGHAQAQVKAGYLAQDQKNYLAALEWYAKAALQGHSHGQYSLALLYLDPKFTQREPTQSVSQQRQQAQTQFLQQQGQYQAVYWLHKAAYLNNRSAQYQLGDMYFQGKFLPEDYAMAYAWWTVALQDQYEISPDNLKLLVKNMTPANKALAANLAKKLQQNYADLRLYEWSTNNP